MNTNMRFIALIFVLIASNVAAVEFRYLCIGEELAQTNFYDGEATLFERKTEASQF